MIALFQRSASVPADLKASPLPAQAGPIPLWGARLRLVAITCEMLAAEEMLLEPGTCAEARAALGRMLSVKLTGEWPPADWEPHVLQFILKQFQEYPETIGWHRYVLASDALGRHRTLVGCVGAFPKANGEVEIGYSTLPQYQRRGFATASARTLIDWLLMQDGVTSVCAQTFSHLPESIKVMERCGMSYAGAGFEPGTVLYRRSR